MHCKACEILARHTCDDIQWIQCDSVSHKRGLLEVDIADARSEKELIMAMEKHWYMYSENPPRPSWWWHVLSAHDIVTLFAIIAVIMTWWFVVDFLWRQKSLMSIVWGTGYMTAMVTWLVASVSTCLAVTWWIVVWFSNYIDDEKTTVKHVGVQLLFQLWRIGWFFVFWSLLWLLGDVIRVSISITIVLSMVVALLMIYMWWHMLRLLPPLSYWWVSLPWSRSKKLHTHDHPWVAPLVWALTFFIPCGFTQWMQLIALWSGNWIIGWATMALFALWTAPVLCMLGLWSTWIKDRSRWLATQIIWVIVVVFGLSTIATTRNLIGRWSWNISWNESEQSFVADGESVSLTVVHDGWQIEDRNISLPANTPYELVITPKANGIGCMSSMVIPKAWFRDPQVIRKDVPLVFAWEWLAPWRYPIVCASMWMEMGAIIVQ